MPFQRDLVVARRHPKKLGTGLTVAGGVITAVGLAVLISNHSSKPGVAIAAGGAGLLVGGVTILTF